MEDQLLKMGIITMSDVINRIIEGVDIGFWDVVGCKDITAEFYWKNIPCEQNMIIGLA